MGLEAATMDPPKPQMRQKTKTLESSFSPKAFNSPEVGTDLGRDFETPYVPLNTSFPFDIPP